MYITETTENVRNLWKQLEVQDDLSKLKFLIYIFGLLNNNQINDKNEANPNLIEEDIIIFNLENIGFPLNAGTMLLQHFMMLYNNITKTNSIYEDNGNILGINYNEIENEMNSQFEKLNFNEKLDIFSEIVISYDKETYFDKKITIMPFDSELSGFELANMIQKLAKMIKAKTDISLTYSLFNRIILFLNIFQIVLYLIKARYFLPKKAIYFLPLLRPIFR